MNNAVKQFLDIESIMKNREPAAVGEAKKLEHDIVNLSTADSDAIWKILWNKPLYAYTKVSIADRYIERLTPFVSGENRHKWADEDHPYLVCNGKANLESSFDFTEHAPESVRDLAISKARLFAVSGGARALRKWSLDSDTPLKHFVTADSDTLIKSMRADLGLRWGHITVMHFLTDAGLFCKPDRHLVRSSHALGIAGGCSPNREVPTWKEAIIIDQNVKQLVKDLDGELTGPRLRYVDKILMDASRLGYLSEVPQ